ncbi:MAG: ankyrin repeat domain-containing protein [Acidobacteriota bacterium]
MPVRCEAGGTTVRHVWLRRADGQPVADPALTEELFTAFLLLDGLAPDALLAQAREYQERAQRYRADGESFRAISRDATILDVADEVFSRTIAPGATPASFFDLDFAATLYESTARIFSLYSGEAPLTDPESLRNELHQYRRGLVRETLGDVKSLSEAEQSAAAMSSLLAQRSDLTKALAAETNFARRTQIKGALAGVNKNIKAQAGALGWSLFSRLENTGEVAANSAEFALLNRAAFVYASMIAGIYRRASAGTATADDVLALTLLVPSSIRMREELLDRYLDEYRNRKVTISGVLWQGAQALLGGPDVEEACARAIVTNRDLLAMQQAFIRRALLAIEVETRAACARPVEPPADETTRRLWDALKNEQWDAARALVDKGAKLDARTPDGGTALLVAARSGAPVELATLMLDRGANAAATDREGRTPLFFVYDVNKELARVLVTRGANVNARDQAGRTPLMGAPSYYGEVLAVLLELGADPHAQDLKGRTAVHHAAGAGGWDEGMAAMIVEPLLKAGAQVNARDVLGWTPLMYAVGGCKADLARMLLDWGARPDLADPSGRSALDPTLRSTARERREACQETAEVLRRVDTQERRRAYYTERLFVAVEANQAVRATALIEAGADLAGRDEYGHTLLHAALRYHHPEMVRLLLDHGADPNLPAEGRCAVLSEAIPENPDLVPALLDHGANPNARADGAECLSPLEAACRAGNLQVAALLLDRGARITQSTIRCALRNCRPQLVSLFLDRGAVVEPFRFESWDSICPEALAIAQSHGLPFDDLGFREEYTLPPDEVLKRALEANLGANGYAGDADVARVALSRGARAEQIFQGDDTMLMWALGQGQSAIAELLLQHGANAGYVSSSRRTPLWEVVCANTATVARWSRSDQLAMARRLIALGANARVSPHLGEPLFCAVFDGNVDLARLLLENGADPNQRNVVGDTPLTWASRYGMRAMADLLLESGADPALRGRYELTALEQTQIHDANESEDVRAQKLAIADLLRSRMEARATPAQPPTSVAPPAGERPATPTASLDGSVWRFQSPKTTTYMCLQSTGEVGRNWSSAQGPWQKNPGETTRWRYSGGVLILEFIQDGRPSDSTTCRVPMPDPGARSLSGTCEFPGQGFRITLERVD